MPRGPSSHQGSARIPPIPPALPSCLCVSACQGGPGGWQSSHTIPVTWRVPPAFQRQWVGTRDPSAPQSAASTWLVHGSRSRCCQYPFPFLVLNSLLKIEFGCKKQRLEITLTWDGILFLSHIREARPTQQLHGADRCQGPRSFCSVGLVAFILKRAS